MKNELKTLIEQGDAARLPTALTASPALAREPISFGPQDQHSVPPLH